MEYFTFKPPVKPTKNTLSSAICLDDYKKTPVQSTKNAPYNEFNFSNYKDLIANLLSDPSFSPNMTEEEMELYKLQKQGELDKIENFFKIISNLVTSWSVSHTPINMAKAFFYDQLNGLPKEIEYFEMETPEDISDLRLNLERNLGLIRLLFDKDFEENENIKGLVSDKFYVQFFLSLDSFVKNFNLLRSDPRIYNEFVRLWWVLHCFEIEPFGKGQSFQEFVDISFKKNPSSQISLLKIAYFWNQSEDIKVLDSMLEKMNLKLEKPLTPAELSLESFEESFKMIDSIIKSHYAPRKSFILFNNLLIKYQFACLYNDSFAKTKTPFDPDLTERILTGLKELLNAFQAIKYFPSEETSLILDKKIEEMNLLACYESGLLPKFSKNANNYHSYFFSKIIDDIDLFITYAQFMDPNTLSKIIDTKGFTFIKHIENSSNNLINEFYSLEPGVTRYEIAEKIWLYQQPKANSSEFGSEYLLEVQKETECVRINETYISKKQEILNNLIKVLKMIDSKDFFDKHPNIEILINELITLRNTRKDLEIRDFDLGIIKLDLDSSLDEVLLLVYLKFSNELKHIKYIRSNLFCILKFKMEDKSASSNQIKWYRKLLNTLLKSEPK
jgi:hypothetical protein